MTGIQTTLQLRLVVDDAGSAAMAAHGATVVFPVAEQNHGSRDGRLQDPFGHLWLLTQPLADVS